MSSFIKSLVSLSAFVVLSAISLSSIAEQESTVKTETASRAEGKNSLEKLPTIEESQLDW